MNYKTLEKIGPTPAVLDGILRNLCSECRSVSKKLDFCVSKELSTTKSYYAYCSMMCKNCKSYMTEVRLKTTLKDIIAFKMINNL